MSLQVLDKNGKSLSKQAVDARFSDKPISFIKKILEAYLFKTNTLLANKQDLGWMNLFNRILIKDGTRFDLPEILANHFKGFGGSCTSDSAICIQLEYDLKTGEIAEFKTTFANMPDSKDAQLTKDNIQKGDLILRDFGYFGLNIFEEMMLKNAYFISKLNSQVTVFEKINNEFKILDFKTLKKRFKKTGSQNIELKHDLEKKKSRKNQEETHSITYCTTVD